jgi:hypothetical protein
MCELTLDLLKSILVYDPLTGIFVDKNGFKVGSINQAGYVIIIINSIKYSAHILAWFYMTGQLPKNEIDHKNRVSNDNRFNNLREISTKVEQRGNQALPTTNKTGLKGVCFDKVRNTWRANLGTKKGQKFLGRYEDIFEASNAYNEAAMRYFGEYAYVNPDEAETLSIIKQCALLSYKIYQYDNDQPLSNFTFNTVKSIFYGLYETDKYNYIIFRGSTTFHDWLHNFNCVYDPFETTTLFGQVHPGAFEDSEECVKKIFSQLNLDKQVIISGHSRGSMLADVVTAWFIYNNRHPYAKITFGSPRIGNDIFCNYIKNVLSYSFRNMAPDRSRYDPVTSVPFDLYPEVYKHPTPLFNIYEPAKSGDEWGIFSMHHMDLYLNAINRLTEVELSLHTNEKAKLMSLYY